MRYIDLFHHPALLTDEAEYFLALFRSAIDFVVDIDESKLTSKNKESDNKDADRVPRYCMLPSFL